MTLARDIRAVLMLSLALAWPASGAILDGATTTFPNAAITRARLGIWSSNETAAMGLSLTNLVNDRSVALSNLAYAIGAAGTNYTLAASNSLYTTLAALTYGIGSAATNYTLAASNALAGMSGGDAGGTNSRQHGTLSLTNLSGNPNVATNLLGAGTVTVTSNNLGQWTITGSAAGDAGGTNSRQHGTLSLTNLSGNPNVATNILGAGTVTVSSNNAGVWTITGAGGGGLTTNANQFGASTELTIRTGAKLTNLIVHAGNTNQTNLIIMQNIGQLLPLFTLYGSNGTMLAGFDEHGHLLLSNIPPAGRPITNTVEMEGSFYGRTQPNWLDDASNSYPMQAFTHRRVEIGPGTGTRLSAWGTGPVTNGGTTVSTPAPTEYLPLMAQFATGATSNNSASVASDSVVAFSGTREGFNGWWFAGEWAVTNGVIEYGGGGLGVFVGLSDVAAASQTNMATTTNVASTRYAGFAVHSQLGAGATNWHFVTKDNSGANETRIATPMPLLASNVYRGWVHCPPLGRTLGVRLDNLTAGTSTSFWATATVPTNGLRLLAAIANRTNRVHSLRISRLYLEAPTYP